MKLFVTSDIHGYFNEFKKALDEAGFDENNKEHYLITCGDHFDRGPQPEQVMKYLMSLERWIGIKGNHENLLENCINRGYPYSYDWSNGTAQTIIDLAPNTQTFDVACSVVYERTKDFMNKLIDYFETERFVFTHGFLPVNCDDNLPFHYQQNRKFSKMENWRKATNKQWQNARWLNGMNMVANGFDIEKCVIVGHYHASWGRHQFEGKSEFGEGSDFSPYYYKDKLIAIDSCVAYTGKLNCLILEDNFINGKS